MAATAGAFLLTAGTGTVASATLAYGAFTVYAVGFVATTLATNLVMRALTPKPSSSSSGTQGYNVTANGSALDHQVIYGRVRIAGARVFDATTGTDNKTLHRVLAFSGHEVESFDEVYLNDELVTLDGSGNVTYPSRYSGKVTIKKHLGATDQLADADLVSAVSEWTDYHRLQGISYLYVKFTFDADAFPNGVPEVTAIIKGKKVYDPRSGVVAWSDNPALCIRDYLTEANYGMGEDTTNIDDALVITAANICDQTNTYDSTTRYTCNGAFTTATTPYDMLSSILTSMGGMLWYAQGKWRMKPSYWTTPSVTLGEDDLRSSISVVTRHSRRDNFNSVNGTFRGAESNWQITDFPPVTNAAFLAADNGQESAIDLNLSFTDNSIEARRISRIVLERNRQQLTISASFGLKAFKVQVGDNVYLNNARFGWSNKAFEVVSWNFGLVDNLDLQVNMTLREISANVFDEVNDGIIYERDNTNLLSPFEVPLPSLDSAVVSTTINTDGTSIPQISFSWTVLDPSIVERYEFQWKLSSSSVWQSASVLTPNFILTPALSGVAYDYRVRAINYLGVHSDFVSSVNPASTGDDGTVPKAPTALTATSGSESIKLTWDTPTQNTDNSTLKDLYQHKIYRNTSDTFNSATLLGRISGNIFTDSSLIGGQTYYYWVTALDYTGNESAESTSAFAIAASIQAPRQNGVYYIGVTTLPTTSSGAHTDFVNAIGQPVDRDQAWFYTGILSYPLSQTVWIYEENLGPTPETSWNLQEAVMVGDLLVGGTVTANKLVLDNITVESGPSGELLIKDLGVDTAKINNLSVDTIKIRDNAVTIPISAYTEGVFTTTAGAGWQDVQTITLSSADSPTMLVASLVVDNIGTSVEPYYRIFNKTTNQNLYGPVYAATWSGAPMGFSSGIQVQSPNSVIALQWISSTAGGGQGFYIGNRSITAITVKK